jgi:hypothetical protein
VILRAGLAPEFEADVRHLIDGNNAPERAIWRAATLPEVLVLKALANGQPFMGAAFMITLKDEEPRIATPLGTYDECGEYRIERDELERLQRQAIVTGFSLGQKRAQAVFCRRDSSCSRT